MAHRDPPAHDEPDPLALLAVAEAQHRARNLVSIAIALANQSLHDLSSHPSVEIYLDRLRSLDAVARIGCEVNGDFCHVDRIASQVTNRLDDPGRPRIKRAGDDVAVSARWAHFLAIILHELTANALRHGALSVPIGRVDLRWTLETRGPDEEGVLHLTWREIDGPKASGPTIPGFGTHLLRNLVRASPRCSAELRFSGTGLIYALALTLHVGEFDR